MYGSTLKWKVYLICGVLFILAFYVYYFICWFSCKVLSDWNALLHFTSYIRYQFFFLSQLQFRGTCLRRETHSIYDENVWMCGMLHYALLMTAQSSYFHFVAKENLTRIKNVRMRVCVWGTARGLRLTCGKSFDQTLHCGTTCACNKSWGTTNMAQLQLAIKTGNLTNFRWFRAANLRNNLQV